MAALTHKSHVLAYSILALFAIHTSCLSQETQLSPMPTPPRNKVQFLTRNAQRFFNIESSLQSAILNKNTKALETLMSTDFSEYMANRPADAITRDVWIDTMHTHTELGKRQITNLSAIHLDHHTLVSFQLSAWGASQL